MRHRHPSAGPVELRSSTTSAPHAFDHRRRQATGCAQSSQISSERESCYTKVYSGCQLAKDHGACACSTPGIWSRYKNCLADTPHASCHASAALNDPQIVFSCNTLTAAGPASTNMATLSPSSLRITTSLPRPTTKPSTSASSQSQASGVLSVTTPPSTLTSSSATGETTDTGALSASGSGLTTSTLSSTSASAPTITPSARWSGSGNLLQGDCAVPMYTHFDAETITYAAFIGCMNGRPECCPFTAMSMGPSPTNSAGLITGIARRDASDLYPKAENTAQATLSKCPDDYTSISNACCPKGYQLWSTDLGGQTPCFTSSSFTLPPTQVMSTMTANATITAAASVTNNSTNVDTSKPTTTIVNMVYAMQFPVVPPPSGLPTGVKVGIGAASGAAALAILLVLLFFFRTRRASKEKPASVPNIVGPIEKRATGFFPSTAVTRRPVSPALTEYNFPFKPSNEAEAAPPQRNDSHSFELRQIAPERRPSNFSYGSSAYSLHEPEKRGSVVSVYDFPKPKTGGNSTVGGMNVPRVAYRPRRDELDDLDDDSEEELPPPRRVHEPPAPVYRSAAPPRLPDIQEVERFSSSSSFDWDGNWI